MDKNEYRFFELDPADEYQYAVCEQNGPDEQPTVEWVDLENVEFRMENEVVRFVE